MTPFIFYRHLELLTNAQIWFCDLDVEHQLWTDARGVVELDVDPGIHWFKIRLDGEWCYTTAELVKRHTPVKVHVQTLDDRGTTLPHLRTAMERMVTELGGRYTFTEALGRGGTGMVFKAQDQLLGRPVAVKVLHGEMVDDEVAFRRFLREAQGLARLSHPNLIAIHDITQLADEVVLITEYVEGSNLGHIVHTQGALPQHVVLKLGIQLIRVLAYLHEHAYLHRDIKPANIMLQPDGTLRLVDFGLARTIEGVNNARTTHHRGTPAYMAPEQYTGDDITMQTDLYQAGVTLYELLTGELPFGAENPGHGHLHKEPPSLREKKPTLNKKLAAAIHRCLAKKPEERWSSAQELMHTLQKIYLELGNNYPRKESVSSMRHTRPPGVSASVLVEWHELEHGAPKTPWHQQARWRKAVRATIAVVLTILAFVAGAIWSRDRGVQDASLNTTTPTSLTNTITRDAPKPPPARPSGENRTIPVTIPSTHQRLLPVLASEPCDPQPTPPLYVLLTSPPEEERQDEQERPKRARRARRHAPPSLYMFASTADEPPLLKAEARAPSLLLPTRRGAAAADDLLPVATR